MAVGIEINWIGMSMTMTVVKRFAEFIFASKLWTVDASTFSYTTNDGPME
jgi:hypothetical protein